MSSVITAGLDVRNISVTRLFISYAAFPVSRLREFKAHFSPTRDFSSTWTQKGIAGSVTHLTCYIISPRFTSKALSTISCCVITDKCVYVPYGDQ